MMTKLNSHLKKGLIGILSLTLILSSLNVYAMDLDNSNVIIEEDDINDDENSNKEIILEENSENNIDNDFDVNEYLKNNTLVNPILDDYNINQEDEISLMSNDNEENSITITSLNEENIATQSNDTTTIDVTGLASGSETSHNCNKYLTNKYDSTYHWQQCSICGKIYNKESHNIVDSGWTRGTPNDCNEDNVHKFTCNCGYSYSNTNGRKQHKFSKVQNLGSYSAYETCYDCNQSASQNYHKCKKADGSFICGENLGTCAICGYNYTYVFHHAVESYYKAGEYVKCLNGENLAYVNENKYQLNSVGNGTMITNIIVPSNYKNINNGSYDQYTSDTNVKVSLNNVNVFGTNWTANQTITYTGHSENVCRARICFTATKEDNCNILLFLNKLIYPENEVPIISTITQQDITSSNGWATQKKITIKGTENYCQTVNIKVKDSKGNIIASGKSSTDKTITKNYALGGNWTFTFTPNIEIDEKGETYTAIVSDSFGYESQKQFIIKQIDSKAPTPTSGTTTSTTWSTNKNMTFTANDVGSGNVQIAFNNTKNYLSTTKNNTSYSKTYTFIGDVYGSTKAAVYYKDALGNETTQFVTISNIDNTKPTITKVESSKALGSTSLTIIANDINTTLNKSGSGVSKYIITSSNSTPSEDDANWQDSNVLKVTTPGTYYIFAKDLVGNISNAYKVDVKVDYTLSVNPNGGSWNNSSSTQDFTITNGDTKTIANPSRTGYTFKNWTLSGTNAKFENSIFTMGNTNASLVANWNINQYNVTYIDVVDSTSGKQLGKTTKKVNYNSNVRGSDIGSSTSDNVYYNGYYYSFDTNATVTTSGATVYRIFKLRTIDKTSNLTWNDNNNKNGFRPSKYTLKLMRNGALFKQVELTSSQTSYTFSNLTKYDSKGNAFKYTFQVDASDRYKITLDSNGNTITENYQNSTFSVTIPKTISLNGLTGKGNYNVKVNGTFYYNDTLTVTPSSSFTLKDRSGVSTLQANVTQNVTTFTKNNLGSTSGSISLNKTKFAGKFNGTFNFNIKFIMKN